MTLSNLNFYNPAETTRSPNEAYSRLASDEQIERTVRALEANGIRAIVAANGEEAKAKLYELLPAGAEVFTSSSATLSQLGLTDEIDRPDGRYHSVRVRLSKLDPKTQNREMQKLGATPEYILGSVHAVTEAGHVLVASATGSQLAPYAASAAKVIWIAGTQKIVPTFEDALKRLDEYTLPLEDQRALKVYGVHSGIAKLLIIRREAMPGRATMILVKENLGF
ncbi:MAG: LUD domain-containing protein [Anaerolineales bacterium]